MNTRRPMLSPVVSFVSVIAACALLLAPLAVSADPVPPPARVKKAKKPDAKSPDAKSPDAKSPETKDPAAKPKDPAAKEKGPTRD